MKAAPARKAAFDILRRIALEKAFSSVLLPLYEEKLSPPDRGLCHELVLGCLRRQIYLDRMIDHFAGGKKIDTEVRIALRLGVYQLYFLERVPHYSALNESVELVKLARKTSAAGFVNAILRRASRERPDLKFQDDLDRLSVETSHPAWLLEKWSRQFGWDECERLARANNESPPLAFRILEATSEVEPILARSAVSENVSDAFVFTGNGSNLSPFARRNVIYLQDEASQMAARAVQVPFGGWFLDVCAAPGGKTGLVSRIHPQAAVIAGDLHSKRVAFLRDNCHSQGVKVGIAQYDAERALPFTDESFDAVLVDAPCSGTGTIRANPETRYHLDPADLENLKKKQLAILTNASKLVKRGGTLVYSTCSLEPEENEEVCGEFAAHQRAFEMIPPVVPERFLTEQGFARTWPHRDGMDGFFIASFRRE